MNNIVIIIVILNKKITPKELVGDWSRKYYIYNQGMAYSGFQGAADHYGIGKIEQTTSMQRVVQALSNNQPVVSNQRAGLFTSGGHYIVLRGVTSDGKILVNDPNKANAVGKGYNNRKFTQNEIQQANKMYFIYPKKK